MVGGIVGLAAEGELLRIPSEGDLAAGEDPGDDGV